METFNRLVEFYKLESPKNASTFPKDKLLALEKVKTKKGSHREIEA